MERESIGRRIKSAVINWATGKLLPRIILAAIAASAAGIMQVYGNLADRFPGLQEIVDPQLLVNLTSQFVIAIVLLLVARWTGKPVREWQQKLDDAGVYSGRQDGWLGPRTDDALNRAINDRRVFRGGRLAHRQSP